MFGVRISRWVFLIVGLIVAGVIAGILLTNQQALAAPEQPIPFSHSTHRSAGITCVFCHTSALRSPIAGIPSVQKCMGCHAVIGRSREVIKKIAAYYDQNQPIPWAVVNRQPDFVYFSHQSHLGAGVSCETCHGDVGHMEVVRPVVIMDMGWCLNCHLKQPSDKVGRVTDCLACHK